MSDETNIPIGLLDEKKENPFTGNQSATGDWGVKGGLNTSLGKDQGGIKANLIGNVETSGNQQQGLNNINGNLQASLGWKDDTGNSLQLNPKLGVSNNTEEPKALVEVGDVKHQNPTAKTEMKTDFGVDASFKNGKGFGATAAIDQNGYQVGANYQTPQKPDGTTVNLGTSYTNSGGVSALNANAGVAMAKGDLHESLGVSFGTDGSNSAIGATAGISKDYQTQAGQLTPYAKAAASTTFPNGSGSIFNAAKANVDVGANIGTRYGTFGGGIEQSITKPGDRRVYTNYSVALGKLNPF